MAKRRKSKKSSKCPEPLNTMIDIAAGLTMGAVASHMEKKYNYSKKGKINPYAVSAMGLASGRMKSTEDILRTGAVLGAMGSFDVEADEPIAHHRYVPEDPVFRDIRETKKNDNRYAWRLNCEDGSEYGLSPYDYETRDEYNTAIREAKSEGIFTEPHETDCGRKEKAILTDDKYLYVRISRLDNGANQYYISNSPDRKIGDKVNVPTENGSVDGIIIAMTWYTAADAPQPPEETLRII